jgi:hypothetical protein
MAASRRRKPCPKVTPPVEVVQATVTSLYTSFFPGADPDVVMGRLRTTGAHHELMQIAYPETEDTEGMEYGRALDEFEGELAGWLSSAAEAHAEHQRRLQSRRGPRS